MTVVEISECFPNKFKPVTGEFILQHARALSAHANVILIVPLRMVPPKELFTGNPLMWIPNLIEWVKGIRTTGSFTEKNLRIIYLKYFSLPRPFFQNSDEDTIDLLYKKKLHKLLTQLKPDVIYCHWLRPWAKTAASISKSLNVPFVIDHHEDIPTLKKFFPDKYKKILSVTENSNAVIVHSSLNKKELLEEKLNIPGVSISYLGQNFSIDEKSKIFGTVLKIACVSHLYEERKNIDVLLRAASKLNGSMDFKIQIAGDGPLKKRYEDLTASLGLNDKVTFLGNRSRNEINELLEKSDIFVLPSYPEAFGIVFIEALSNGLPVITCKNNGGGEELKKLGYPIVLVNPNSPDELCEAIVNLNVNRKEMNAMSEVGKKIVKEYFTWDKNAETTIEILCGTIKKHKLDS